MRWGWFGRAEVGKGGTVEAFLLEILSGGGEVVDFGGSAAHKGYTFIEKS